MNRRVFGLKQKFFANDEHPFSIFERRIQSYLTSNSVILDAGCGRTAPLLGKFAPLVGRAIGVDLVDFGGLKTSVELYRADLASVPLANDSVDIVFCRSVLEHLERPDDVFREMGRILKPGGHLICLTPSLFDYASLIAVLVPNRLHPHVVHWTEGRPKSDVFPTYYRSNTRRSIVRLAKNNGFHLVEFQYLGQYPSYLAFNTLLFRLGSYYELFLRRHPRLQFLRGWILADLCRRRKSDSQD